MRIPLSYKLAQDLALYALMEEEYCSSYVFIHFYGCNIYINELKLAMQILMIYYLLYKEFAFNIIGDSKSFFQDFH